MTLADRFTLARLVLMPLIVAAYLLLPPIWALWVVGWSCGLAEYTDLLDGRIARARGEVSDFGKLADPFCDVIYRIGVFLAYLLPVGFWSGSAPLFAVGPQDLPIGEVPGQLVFLTADGAARCGLVPWLPVFLMVLREIIAGALRAMTATRGLVLAARTSGKIKAWVQGTTIITCVAFPGAFFSQKPWILHWAMWMTWLCAVISVVSIIEYIWVNRTVLAHLLERHQPQRIPS